MTGFPPAPEDQVSLANWREAPFNRWSFRHVREIIPTADIAHDPHRVSALPIGLVDTDNIRIRGAKDRVLSLDDFLMAASTDSLVILHRGRIVVERYADGMTAETPHILMSVSKSLLGLLTGILVSERILDQDGQVTTLIPEVSETAYKGATIRHLLDMRAGVAFDEDYTATSGRSSSIGKRRTGILSSRANVRLTCGPSTRACGPRMAGMAAVSTTSRRIRTYWAG